MNTLILNKSRFDFDVEVIFNMYLNSAVLYSPIPSVEDVTQFYDIRVQDKLRELYLTLNPEEKSGVNHPWRKLYELPPETIMELDGLIEMKTLLSKKEIVSVLLAYNFLFLDDYGKFCNVPVKEVW